MAPTPTVCFLLALRLRLAGWRLAGGLATESSLSVAGQKHI